MKKLGHLGTYILLVFLSVYLLEFSSLHIAKFSGWGIDGYYSISAVGEVTLLVMFVCWLKKKKMLYIFEKKGSKKSRFFYLVFALVATYFVRQLLDTFQLQFHHLIDNKFIFQDLISTLYSNGQSTFLATIFYFISSVIIAPIF